MKYFPPTRMTDNNKCWKGCGEIRAFIYYLQECKKKKKKKPAATLENGLAVPHSVTWRLPYDPEIPLLDFYSRNRNICPHKTF
jgi:hypothetical protein